jgi:hypothetical protein
MRSYDSCVYICMLHRGRRDDGRMVVVFTSV